MFISAVMLLAGHLVDTPLNGTENAIERSVILLLSQALFFFVVWGCDRLFLRRLSYYYRWLAVWATMATLAAIWGILFSWILWQLGLAPSFNFVPRINGWVSNLAVITVLVAVVYGLLRETASLRREQEDIEARIEKLNLVNQEQRETDAAVIQGIRSQLEEVLGSGSDSPQNTLGALRIAIDEIIRPVTRKLSEQLAGVQIVQDKKEVPIYWRRVAARLDEHSRGAVFAGAILFSLSSLSIVSRQIGFGQGVIVLTGITMLLTITTLLLNRLSKSLPRKLHATAVPVVLALSAAICATVFRSLVAWDESVTYYIAFIFRYLFFGVSTIFLVLAFDENRRTSVFIMSNRANLDWALARAHEVHSYHNRLLTRVLHGRWQAILAAAAIRLQMALREEGSADEAVAIARAEVKQLSLEDFYQQQAPRSINEAVEETSSLWEGVAEITWKPEGDVTEAVDRDPVCARLCGELILELCTNAIKHAGASSIEISLMRVDERIIRLSVCNDGTPQRVGEQGYGARLLNQSCVKWNRKVDRGNTYVSADIPWSHGEVPNTMGAQYALGSLDQEESASTPKQME